MTGGNVKFMLLMNADPSATPYSNYQPQPGSRPNTARTSTLLASNPTSAQTEEAVKAFMLEVGMHLVQRTITDESRCTKHG